MATVLLLLLLAVGMLPANSQNDNMRLGSCCDQRFHVFSSSSTVKSSGLYVISNFCGNDWFTAEAYCDMKTERGGWVVVQRRQDGSVDFNRTWVEYEDGFGKLTGEFWYGLRPLYCLTSQGDWEMRMDIKYKDGSSNFLHYKQFKVASAEEKYKLTVGEFQWTTTTNPMAYHDQMYFSTIDNDNDQYKRNCTILFDPDKPAGGWWYHSCWQINPNDFYSHLGDLLVNSYFIEMKIRPLNCII